MKLEDLANELLLDLFELLDTVDLFEAFYNLNTRFNTLLLTDLRAFHLDLRSVTKDRFHRLCQQQQLPIVIDRVVSLHLSNGDETPELVDLLLSFDVTLDRFVHLQRLSLSHVRSSDTLNTILRQCRTLPFLTHLNLIECVSKNTMQTDTVTLMTNVWSLPALSHCSIDHLSFNGVSLADMPVVSQTIKSLSLKKTYAPLTILYHVLRLTPHLERLHMSDIIGYDNEEEQATATSSLTSLHISYTGSMGSLEQLFLNLPHLRRLTIRTSSIYLSGFIWQELIIRCLPRLAGLSLNMEFRTRSHQNREKELNELVASFRTPFWLDEHRWFVQLSYNPESAFNTDILFTVPYGLDELSYFSNDLPIASTCLKDNYACVYDRVRTLRYKTAGGNTRSKLHSWTFPCIRYLEIDALFDEHLLSILPSRLNDLTSVRVTCSEDVGDSQLQKLLDRAPHLYRLTIQYDCSIQSIFDRWRSSSIRRLALLPSSTDESDLAFDEADCWALYSTPLGRQCEVLSIHVKQRLTIVQLIKRMPCLRLLTVRCYDTTFDIWQSSSAHDELIDWLRSHCPSTCRISRNTTTASDIDLWIDTEPGLLTVETCSRRS